MKPHIKKVGSLWFCGKKDGERLSNFACHKSPQKAYLSWRREINHAASLRAKQRVIGMLAEGGL